MKLNRFTALAGVALLLLAACASTGPGMSPAMSREQATAIVASPDRTAADRENDARRNPVDLLAFIGARPGMTALDVSAGRGYTTELVARAVGTTGTVIGQSPMPANGNAAPPPASGPARRSTSAMRSS